MDKPMEKKIDKYFDRKEALISGQKFAPMNREEAFRVGTELTPMSRKEALIQELSAANQMDWAEVSVTKALQSTADAKAYIFGYDTKEPGGDPHWFVIGATQRVFLRKLKSENFYYMPFYGDNKNITLTVTSTSGVNVESSALHVYKLTFSVDSGAAMQIKVTENVPM